MFDSGTPEVVPTIRRIRGGVVRGPGFRHNDTNMPGSSGCVFGEPRKRLWVQPIFPVGPRGGLEMHHETVVDPKELMTHHALVL